MEIECDESSDHSRLKKNTLKSIFDRIQNLARNFDEREDFLKKDTK